MPTLATHRITSANAVLEEGAQGVRVNGEEGVGEDEGVKGCLPSPAPGPRPPEAYWPAPWPGPSPAFQKQFPSVFWGGRGVGVFLATSSK